MLIIALSAKYNKTNIAKEFCIIKTEHTSDITNIEGKLYINSS
jgi:hypothetical protein